MHNASFLAFPLPQETMDTTVYLLCPFPLPCFGVSCPSQTFPPQLHAQSSTYPVSFWVNLPSNGGLLLTILEGGGYIWLWCVCPLQWEWGKSYQLALSIFLCMLWRVDIKCLCFLKCQLSNLAFTWVIPAVSKVVLLFTVHFYTMLCASTTNFCRVPNS